MISIGVPTFSGEFLHLPVFACLVGRAIQFPATSDLSLGNFGVMFTEDIPRNLSLCQKKQGSLEPRTFFKNEVMGI